MTDVGMGFGRIREIFIPKTEGNVDQDFSSESGVRSGTKNPPGAKRMGHTIFCFQLWAFSLLFLIPQSAFRNPKLDHVSIPISLSFATIFSFSKTPTCLKTSFPFESKKTRVGMSCTLYSLARF